MHSSSIPSLLIAVTAFAALPALHAAATITKGHVASDKGFKLDPVPLPAINDAAAKAVFSLIDGEKDSGSGELAVLADGKVPTGEDQPGSNFFFGSDGGRMGVDMGQITSLQSVATYSWHGGNRGPQVYKLYASDGTEKGFNATPKRGTDPKTCGWDPIAAIDTRTRSGNGGGQHGVEVTNGSKPLGHYRYLLFDIERTTKSDPTANTFFSEVDVINAKEPGVQRLKPNGKIVKTFKAKDGKYTYVMDTTKAPELTEWCEKELIPVIEEWYPKLVLMLPSNGYRAPDVVSFEFRDDMGGTPAYAAGNKISMSAPWFPGQLDNEAKGCVIHEMGHVVQNYWRAQQTNRKPKDTPGWVTEGICDYIRWFLYEPKSRGAGIDADSAEKVNYDQSYRVTGNFLDWVATEKDKELLKKLNAVAREGDYEEKLWKEWTGKTLPELDAEWKEAIKKGKRVQK